MVLRERGRVEFTLEEALVALETEVVPREKGELLVYAEDDNAVLSACMIGQAAISLSGSAVDLYDELDRFYFRPSPSDSEKAVGEIVARESDEGTPARDVVLYLRSFLTPEQLSSKLSIWERSYTYESQTASKEGSV